MKEKLKEKKEFLIIIRRRMNLQNSPLPAPLNPAAAGEGVIRGDLALAERVRWEK